MVKSYVLTLSMIHLRAYSTSVITRLLNKHVTKGFILATEEQTDRLLTHHTAVAFHSGPRASSAFGEPQRYSSLPLLS